MRKLYRVSALAMASLLVAAGATSVVRAADMPEYPPTIETPEPPVFAAAGGWYLRGDIGYKVYNDPSGSISNTNYGGGFHNGNDVMTNMSMGDAYQVDVGAGYKFNDYLRADVTLDYESAASVSGHLFCATPGPTCHNNGNKDYTIEQAKISAYSALVNGYIDLGTYGGFTPYVGAGVGASWLTATDAQTKDGAKYGDGDSVNLAWALMAGASYAIDDRWSVDAGYRYINLGDAQTGDFSDGNGHTAHISYKGIDAHEVRVGLRYNLY